MKILTATGLIVIIGLCVLRVVTGIDGRPGKPVPTGSAYGENLGTVAAEALAETLGTRPVVVLTANSSAPQFKSASAAFVRHLKAKDIDVMVERANDRELPDPDLLPDLGLPPDMVTRLQRAHPDAWLVSLLGAPIDPTMLPRDVRLVIALEQGAPMDLPSLVKSGTIQVGLSWKSLPPEQPFAELEDLTRWMDANVIVLKK